MTPTQVLALSAALLVAAGLWLMLAGCAGWAPNRPRGRRIGLRLPIVVGIGGVVVVVTGWPALGVGAAGAALGIPVMMRSASREEARIERVEGVEEWTRRLADVLAIGVGLEQAMQTAARSAPATIEDEVTTLAARIAARTPTETALRAFADDMDDPAADLVVAALVLASRRRGPGVAAALSAIADSVAEEVIARRRVEADRARPRATAQAVTLITVLIIGVGMLNRGYASPYGSALGQLVLAVTLGFFGAALWWMHSMTTARPAERILPDSHEFRKTDAFAAANPRVGSR